MIRLTTTTQKLQIILGGAVAATQPDILVSWTDTTASAWTGGTTPTVGNSGTAVDICPAPAASTIRTIDLVNVRNNDSASIVATIRFNDNATLYKLVTFTLLTGESLQYTHAGGWCALDANGNRKEVTSSVFSSLTVTGNETVGGTLGVTGNTTLSGTGNVITGTTTNDSAAAGKVGEFLDASATGQTVTSSINNVVSLALTAGDWDVSGTVVFEDTGSNATVIISLVTTSGTNGATFGKNKIYVGANTLATSTFCCIPKLRISLAAPATVYLTAQSGSTMTSNVDGYITARRVR